MRCRDRRGSGDRGEIIEPRRIGHYRSRCRDRCRLRDCPSGRGSRRRHRSSGPRSIEIRRVPPSRLGTHCGDRTPRRHFSVASTACRSAHERGFEIRRFRGKDGGGVGCRRARHPVSRLDYDRDRLWGGRSHREVASSDSPRRAGGGLTGAVHRVGGQRPCRSSRPYPLVSRAQTSRSPSARQALCAARRGGRDGGHGSNAGWARRCGRRAESPAALGSRPVRSPRPSGPGWM